MNRNTFSVVIFLCLIVTIGAWLVAAQGSWSYTVAVYPGSSSFASQCNNRFFASANVLASLTTSGVIFCNYYNGASSNCQNSGVACNTGHFFSPGPDSTIYFYCNVYNFGANTVTNQILVMTVTVTTTSVSSSVLLTITAPETIGGIDIDWSHRWMVAAGTRFHLYDIKNPRQPIYSDVYTGSGPCGGHPRATSIRKNLVCSACGACVRINPASGKFVPQTARTIQGGRSLRIFDDYIIVWNPTVLVYGLNFTLLGSSAWFGNLIDVIRSKDIILTNDLGASTYIVDISNPLSIKTVATLSSASGIHALFNDQYAVYASYWGPLGIQKITLNVPYGYQTFYNNSEWFDYAARVNTLSVSPNFNNSLTYQYGNSYTQLLSVNPVQDTYAPTNLTIFYHVTVASFDYGVECFRNNSWTLITGNSQFTQNEISAGNVRIRYQNQNFPLSRNLNQTISILADNNRGSSLSFNISLSFFYGAGSRCPQNATCTTTTFSCNAGYTLDSTGTTCVGCPIGTFKLNGGNLACPACPPNSACPGATVMFQCQPGFSLNGTSTGCAQCQTGLYKQTTGNTNCSTCPNNATCTVTSFACLPGFAVDASGTSCTPCLIGTYQPTVSGSAACLNCPLNSVCMSPALNMFSCNAGYSLNSTTTGCVPCQVGFYKPTTGNTNCLTCPNNSQCSSASLSIFSCNPGYSLNPSSNDCLPCQSGFFKASAGNGNCMACPENTQCNDAGLSSFTCNAGYYGAANNCLMCPVGTYKAQTGNEACTSCPSGSFCPDGSQSFTCAAGFTLSPSESSCVECPANSFKSTPGNGTCSPCPLNAECSGGITFTCLPSYSWNSTASECTETPLAPPSPSPPGGATNLISTIVNNPLYLGLSISGFILVLTFIVIGFLIWRRLKSRQQAKSTTMSGTAMSTSAIGMTSVLTANMTNGSTHMSTSARSAGVPTAYDHMSNITNNSYTMNSRNSRTISSRHSNASSFNRQPLNAAGAHANNQRTVVRRSQLEGRNSNRSSAVIHGEGAPF